MLRTPLAVLRRFLHNANSSSPTNVASGAATAHALSGPIRLQSSASERPLSVAEPVVLHSLEDVNKPPTIPKIPEFHEWHWSLRSKSHPLTTSVIIASIAGISKFWLNYMLTTKAVNQETLEDLILNRGKRPLITIANHASALDDPVIFANLPWSILKDHRNVRWSLGAAEICFTNDVYSWFFRGGKVLSTKRGDGIYQGSMERALEKLEACEWVHVFPEARIIQEDKLYPFRWGIARLIMESKIPPIVLPFWHQGMDAIMPEGTILRPRPGKQLTVVYGEPIDFSKYEDIWQELKSDFAKVKELHRNFEDTHAAKVRMEIVDILSKALEELRVKTNQITGKNR